MSDPDENEEPQPSGYQESTVNKGLVVAGVCIGIPAFRLVRNLMEDAAAKQLSNAAATQPSDAAATEPSLTDPSTLFPSHSGIAGDPPGDDHSTVTLQLSANTDGSSVLGNTALDPKFLSGPSQEGSSAEERKTDSVGKGKESEGTKSHISDVD
ncbi:hypothetical protein M231_00880 [Tremella mesenterica]|uniref:Uncharacterized protein n=1 Tax=Tremella mesenterica TaxID=5217 RepID=A0A4Q1BUR7_TREME|nr:uncharacterized protein TREMEDRAFT_65766 [Tremella mesenterica DSM 1558]EIW66164.1 hypothetical protein TREMEDRAFT_65766 [Tremella mesenterica DSM 1558]RXK41881.1 hypothetical protein M231_00880 [Tremella mesenterica]